LKIFDVTDYLKIAIFVLQTYFTMGSSWSHKFAALSIRKLLGLKLFCVNCTLYIATLLTIYNGLFFPAKFHQIRDRTLK